MANGGVQMGESALWYAKNGIPVFPVHVAVNGVCSCGNSECDSAGKHPRTAHGHHDASTDPTQVSEWWRRWPNANIGSPTQAPASGSMVVDVDPRNGGDDSLECLILKHGRYPDTAEQISGGGGRHIVFRDPGTALPKTLAPGIDLKGEGGYVVVAPSLHPSGRRYSWMALRAPKPSSISQTRRHGCWR